jgi:hypothetical protein
MPSSPTATAASLAANARPRRDPRIDVLRGLALFMIFIDHIPDNVLSLATMHNFGFCDAAELFVLLSGMSAMLAYGGAFERRGAWHGLRQISRRWAWLYVFQLGLLAATLLIVWLWTSYYGFQPRIVGPFLDDPFAGVLHGLTLSAVPTYLDILPLYLALFAVFPLIYAGLRVSRLLTLAFSAALWAAANLVPALDLPNWANGGQWFFNPFAWQFLFTIGAAIAMLLAAHDGQLPRARWAVWVCAAFLLFALVETVPWSAWHLPDPRQIALASPDQTNLAPLRLVDILALAYLLLSSPTFRAIASARVLWPLDLCGRHSLEVFATGCVVALFGRLLFRTYGAGLPLQIAVNAIGFLAMWGVALYLDRTRASTAGAASHAPQPEVNHQDIGTTARGERN